MKRTLISLAFGLLAAGAGAQVLFNGGVYSQDFNTLATSGTANPWTDNVTLPGWYMRRVNDPNVELADQYDAGTGSSNAGAVYSFGSAGSAERALGSLGSTSVEHAAYGLRLRNNATQNILTFTLTYTGEQWRDGGATTVNFLWFSYRVGGTNIGQDTQNATGEVNYGADPSFIRVSSLDFASIKNTTTATALDGNLAANRTLISGTVTLNTPWAPGTDLWIRWVDVNNPGNDHGISVDDLSFRATPVPEPGTVAAIGLGVGALVARRRRR